jgi:acetylornithine deacetylase
MTEMAQFDHGLVFAELRRRREDLVDLVRALIRCHPIYGSMGQVKALELLADRLSKAGLDVSWNIVDMDQLRRSGLHLDVSSFGPEFADYFATQRPSVTASRQFPGAGPTVLLNGHVDVEFVTSPQSWREPGLWRSGALADGRLYGRGSCDMLGGIACYVHVLTCLRPYLPHLAGGVTVQLVLDEEVGGNGTLSELLRAGPDLPDVALIAEPTDGAVCTTTYGFHQFLVRCYGAPVHMAYARGDANAVRHLASVIDKLEDLDEWLATQVAADRRTRHVMYGRVRG